MAEGSERRDRRGTPRGLLAAVVVLAAAGFVGYVRLETEVAELRGRLLQADGRGGLAAEEAPAARDGGWPVEPDSGPIPCDGVVAEEMVRAAVGAQGRSVFECYEAALGRSPGLAGTLVLDLKVGPRGRVQEAVARRGLSHPGLVQCATAAALAWRFPPPVGGSCARLVVPFSLAPEGSGGLTEAGGRP